MNTVTPSEASPKLGPWAAHGLVKGITIRHTFVALHKWEDAPVFVRYLRYPHRHEFTVTLTVLVDHGNRATEFHTLADKLSAVCSWLFGQHGTQVKMSGDRELNIGLPTVAMSCEDMAEAIFTRFAPHHKVLRVGVSEDGQCEGWIEATNH